MKTKILICGIFFLIVGFVIGASVAMVASTRRNQKRMVLVTLDEVFGAYAPLRLLSEHKTEKAEALLHTRLGEALEHYEERTRGFPVFAGTNMAMVVHAKALYEKLTTQGGTEQDGPANGSQPSRSETNQTSSAAGSRR